MFLKSSFLMISLTFSLVGLCQKKEYLVKLNGDTIHGRILLKNNAFTVTNANGTQEINAEDVKLVKSNKYKGAAVVKCRLQLYSDNYNDLEFGYIKLDYVDTVMILSKILSTPKMDLYFGSSDANTPFYFYKTASDSVPIQLVVRYDLDGGLDNYNRKPGRYVGEKSKIVILENKGYVNQLRAIMGDCENITELDWELLAYREYSLKNVIKKYNDCE